MTESQPSPGAAIPNGSAAPRDRMAALAIGILAALLRLPWLNRLGLHGDEDISSLAARGIAHTGLPILPSGHQYWRAPLYHYLIAPLAAAGVDWWPRVLSVLLSGITAWMIVRWGAEVVGKPAARAAGILFALSLVEISFARQIRMYALYQPLSLVALYFLFRFWATGDRRSGMWSAIAILAALGSHELAVSLVVLYLPLSLRPILSRERIFSFAALAVIALIFRLYRTGIGLGFRAGGVAVAEPPERILSTPFRLWVAAQPQAFGMERLGAAGFIVLLAVAAAAGIVIAVRATRDRPMWPRLAAAIGLAAALGSAASYQIGLSFCILALLSLQRSELFPGRRGAAVLLSATAIVALAGAGWFLVIHGVGYDVRDSALGMMRWPGRLAQLLLWPPAVAIPALAGAALIAFRCWKGTARPGEQFLLVAIGWLVTGRGLLDRRAAERYLADLLPLWELVAGVFVAAVLGSVARRVPETARRQALVPTAVAMLVIALVLPGTNPIETFRLLQRPHGVGGDRVEPPVPDLRGASAWLAPRLAPEDRVVATDWLTTYAYLGRVNGWIRATAYAWQSTSKDGVARDNYVGAQVLPDLVALRAFMEQDGRGTVWIVAGGQELAASSDLVSPAVRAWLLAQTPAFVASDGETRVYRMRR